jgi:membrane protein
MPVPNRLDRWRDRFHHFVWETDPAALAPATGWSVRALRLGQALAAELQRGDLSLRAMGLVYTTLLSFVPLLAFSFSVLKAMGVHNQMRPMLEQLLDPLGPQAAGLTDQIVGFVQHINVGVLGAVGVGFLVFTVISLVHKVEQAFNHTWRVRRPRGFAQRFSGYLSVLLVGPVLVFGALALTASLMSSAVVQGLMAIEPFGSLLRLGMRLAPYGLIIAAFTGVYVIIPNTRVKPSAALAGGVVAGVLWETVGWAFGAFMVGSTKYTAIYSGFAIVMLFLVWLFASWQILLVGAQVAFFVQHPSHQRPGAEAPTLGGRVRERLALLVMYAIGHRHFDGRPPPTAGTLTHRLGVPEAVTAGLLDDLAAAGLVLATGDEPPAWVPAADLERIPLARVLEAVRSAGDGAYPLPAEAAVDAVVEKVDRTVAGALAHATLRGLVQARALEQPENTPAEAPARAPAP